MFRGQSDANQSLLPSFTRYTRSTRATRESPLSSEASLRLERQALTEFTRQAHLHLPSSILREARGLLSWWTLEHSTDEAVLFVLNVCPRNLARFQ